MSFRKILCINIKGQRWNVGYGYPGGRKVRGKIKVNDGLCDWEKRRIIIQRQELGRGRSLGETIFHEVAHARLPDISEDAVEELASLAWKIFTKMQKYEASKEVNSQK